MKVTVLLAFLILTCLTPEISSLRFKKSSNLLKTATASFDNAYVFCIEHISTMKFLQASTSISSKTCDEENERWYLVGSDGAYYIKNKFSNAFITLSGSSFTFTNIPVTSFDISASSSYVYTIKVSGTSTYLVASNGVLTASTSSDTFRIMSISTDQNALVSGARYCIYNDYYPDYLYAYTTKSDGETYLSVSYTKGCDNDEQFWEVKSSSGLWGLVSVKLKSSGVCYLSTHSDYFSLDNGMDGNEVFSITYNNDYTWCVYNSRKDRYLSHAGDKNNAQTHCYSAEKFMFLRIH